LQAAVVNLPRSFEVSLSRESASRSEEGLERRRRCPR
jgi:hypothetical protein